MFYTQQDLVNKNIEIGAITANSQALLDLIESDSNSDYKKAMIDGRKYFEVNNTCVNDTNFNVYNTYRFAGNDNNGNPTYTIQENTNPSSKNIKKPSAIYRNAVLQKIDYGLANGVLIDIENETTKEDILETLGKEKDVKVSSLATEGSNSALSYFYIYIDKDGQFKYMVMDSVELIIIYEDDTRERISEVIRYYKIEKIIDGSSTFMWRVEIYRKDSKEVFDEQGSGAGSLLVSQGLNAYGVIKIKDDEDSEGEAQVNWGRAPFVEYINNPERITDLQPAISLIDDIDLQDSRLSNDFMDKVEQILGVKGFDGDDPHALMEFLKVVGIAFTDGENGGVEGIENKIPYEGKQSVIENTTKDAYEALQAVRTSAETVSKASSGKALQIMYRPLDMKVQRMYQGLEKTLYDLMYFVNEYFGMSNELDSEPKKQFNPDEVKFVFTPNVVVDLVELADIAVKFVSAGLPMSVILDLLPFINQNNKEDILKEIESQQVDLFQEPMTVNDTQE